MHNYMVNSKSIPASDRNQAGSVQLDAKFAVKFETCTFIVCVEFKISCLTLTWHNLGI